MPPLAVRPYEVTLQTRGGGYRYDTVLAYSRANAREKAAIIWSPWAVPISAEPVRPTRAERRAMQ